jgi:hypothetical protein
MPTNPGDTDIGTGTTIGFSSFTMELLSVSWTGIERAAIDTSHMGTTGGRTFIPGDLYDPGEIVADVHLNTTDNPEIGGAAATLTLTFPAVGTNAADAWTASAFMTGFEFTDPLEDKMTAVATFKCSGSIGF